MRAIGILLVVTLHWLMVEATWDGHELVIGNALSHGNAWLLTWLQPLPLLFFAAGAAARYDLDRHPERHAREFLSARLLRIAVPVGVFAGVWVVVLVALPLLGVPGTAIERVARIAPQPLWFLAVQVTLLMLTPLMLRALHRWGARVLVAVALAPLVVDLLRFSDALTVSGAPNVLLVWAVPYLGGLHYSARRDAAPVLLRPDVVPTRGALALCAGAGLASTVLLLATGPYPRSLIGLPGDALSNLGPPTAPVVGFAVFQVATALLARDALAGWAGRSRLVGWVGARSMGLYLWHLTAMFAVCGGVLLAAGRELPEPWTWDWWSTRTGYLGAAALVLVAAVTATSRVERRLHGAAQALSAGRRGPRRPEPDEFARDRRSVQHRPLTEETT